ncbi:MAG: hypothetical protein IJ723_07200 [Ruminococcus sp.]|nr:hypothetical protein [Ruminococcus sp.]
MKKSYKIGNKTLILKASLYTQLAYKALFGRDLLGDLVRADELLKSESYEQRADGRVIYLQALYVLADEGSDETLPPFYDWLSEIDGADIADIIRTVTEMYLSTTKPDRKNG